MHGRIWGRKHHTSAEVSNGHYLSQALSLKLGVATERDLAQACRTAYPPWVNFCLWIIMEVGTLNWVHKP